MYGWSFMHKLQHTNVQKLVNIALTTFRAKTVCMQVVNDYIFHKFSASLCQSSKLYLLINQSILIRFLGCLNAIFSNISAKSWRPVLVVEEAGVPGENHRPWASNW